MCNWTILLPGMADHIVIEHGNDDALDKEDCHWHSASIDPVVLSQVEPCAHLGCGACR